MKGRKKGPGILGCRAEDLPAAAFTDLVVLTWLSWLKNDRLALE